MIRAVLFDLWGTLIVDDPVASAARRLLRIERARDVLASVGLTYNLADIETAFLAAGARHEALHEDELDLSTHGRTEAYLHELDSALKERLDAIAWERLHEAVLTPALMHPPVIMPGARETLAEIRALGLPCGLISNAGITPGYVLRRLLEDMGLLEYLAPTVFSDELEMSKPAEAIFAHALREIGVGAAEAVFVGDQPRLDVSVQGAQACGASS